MNTNTQETPNKNLINSNYLIACKNPIITSSSAGRTYHKLENMCGTPAIIQEIVQGSASTSVSKRIKLEESEESVYSDSVKVRKVSKEEFKAIFTTDVKDVEQSKYFIQANSSKLCTTGVVNCVALIAIGICSSGIMHVDNYESPMINQFLKKLTSDDNEILSLFAIGGSEIEDREYRSLLKTTEKFKIQDVQMLLNPWNIQARPSKPVNSNSFTFSILASKPKKPTNPLVNIEKFIHDSNTTLDVGLTFFPDRIFPELFVSDSCTHSTIDRFADMGAIIKDKFK